MEESEEGLKLAMAVGEHGFWDWDLDTDEIYFSPSYCTMLGYKPGELPLHKDTWIDLLYSVDREKVLPRIENTRRP